jgi:aspartate-semialdehyde dehydrogenase
MEAKKNYDVCIVGATGAVGVELINTLYKRNFPINEFVLYAGPEICGVKVDTPYGPKIIHVFDCDAVRKFDFCFLAVNGEFSKKMAKVISAGTGPIVIDNSSAWRYDVDIPLVIPEINPERALNAKLIANPNCTTAIALVVLYPIFKKYGLKKIVISTYQAASGAGTKGVLELENGFRTWAKEDRIPESRVFSYPLVFNVLPHIDDFQENLYTKEEMKVVWETKKILDEQDINISCTAVRVPTLRAHSEAITVETRQEISSVEEVREILRDAPGIRVVDNPSSLLYPLPARATGEYHVEVGRIRKSLVFKNGLDLFVSGDQLLKGAALNAIQICEVIVDFNSTRSVMLLNPNFSKE